MEVYYAVQVKTGKELVIKEMLKSIVDRRWKDQAVEVLVPMQMVWEKTRKGWKKKSVPILSGYLLLKCNQLTDDLYHIVKHIPGVCRVLRNYISFAEIKIMTEKICSPVTFSKQVIERARKLKGRLLCILAKIKNYKKVVKANLKGKRNTGYKFRFRPLII